MTRLALISVRFKGIIYFAIFLLDKVISKCYTVLTLQDMHNRKQIYSLTSEHAEVCQDLSSCNVKSILIASKHCNDISNMNSGPFIENG